MIHFSTSTRPSSTSLEKAEGGWKALLSRQDLGFWQLPRRDQVWNSSKDFSKRLQASASRLAVIGLGGSAMGGRCLVSSLGQTDRVQFLFNTDPTTVDAFFSDRDLIKNGHFLFISKSGNTLELACLLEILTAKLKSEGRSVASAISVITEEKANPLFNWAKKEKIFIEAHPQDVGGRFSGFTPVGLVPAAFSGVSLEDLRAGVMSGAENRALVTRLSAFYLDSFARGESISVFWAYIDQIAMFQPWLVQLWAESLAKRLDRSAKSASPVSTPVTYLGTCDQHSVLQQLMEGARDKSICFLRDRSLEERGPQLKGEGMEGFQYLGSLNLGRVFQTQSHSTQAALSQAGRTTLSLELDRVDARHLGELMMVFEMVIGVLGEALNINAFDQPGVELGKTITKEKLQKNARL